MSKGSGRRPSKVDKQKFDDNWDAIFNKQSGQKISKEAGAILINAFKECKEEDEKPTCKTNPT